jgi:hypothetical protein
MLTEPVPNDGLFVHFTALGKSGFGERLMVDVAGRRFSESDPPHFQAKWLNSLRDRVMAIRARPGITLSGGNPSSNFGTTTILSGGSVID